MIKPALQHACRRLGIYNRLKASRLYDLYWGYAARSILDQRSREVQFYKLLLPNLKSGDLIFDIGANQGAKTDVFLRLGARVVAIDPDATNQKTLREKFLGLRLVPKPVTIVGKAVSDKNSVAQMWVDAAGSALNTLSEKWVTTLRKDEKRFGSTFDFAEQRTIETVTLDTLIEIYGTPKFTKIDVEGYEPAVLHGLSRPIPLLSFEVNLPEFQNEGLECINRLEQLDPAGLFNYSADCRDGLAQGNWIPKQAFEELFLKCKEPSLEIFWKSSNVP